jgi:alpha-2-macroglobulin
MNALRRLLRAAVGEVSWSPPPWLRTVGRPVRATGDYRRRQPRRFWSAVVAIVLVVAGGYGLQRWIASRPKPDYLSISVANPSPTALEPDAPPNPLRISFSGSAAPLDRIGKTVAEGFTVTPPLIDGTWTWESSSALVFAPAEEWPVGQGYRLDMGPGFLAPQALVHSRRVDFRSPPITATVGGYELWESPTDPKDKRAVVTVELSHPVDKATLEKRLALRMIVDPETRFDGPGAKTLGFKVTYDDKAAKAFVQSEPIAIPPRPGAVQVTLAKGVQAARGGAGTADELSQVVSVPGVETYFRVSGAATAVVTNAAHRMERVTTLEFTAPVRVDTLRPHVVVWELPADRPPLGDEPERKDYAWQDPAEVVPEVLAKARRVEPTWLPSEPEWSKVQSFRFEATGGRTLLLRIEQGATARGDYALVKPYTTVLSVEPMPQVVEILHEGSVLALSGGRKLSVLARNLRAVEIELARLLPGSVAHLASQTDGTFQQPEFNDWRFDEYNLAEVFREVRALAPAAPGDPQYEAVDFGAALSQGGPPRGLFQLRVSGWDPVERKRIDGIESRRIVVVTDLGFLVKDALDGTHDVFVVSVASGQPVADAEVALFGKNGVPVLARTTDANGRATLPKTDGLEREKQPVAYVVQKAGDLSFLPFERRDRRLDLTRFDTGGLTDERELQSLQAYLFSDRGVYRPGEEVTLGVIVKTLDWSPLPAGLPLEVVVVDPRFREIRSETFAVPPDGFRDWRFATFGDSPTGTYRVELHIVRDGERRGLLGQAAVRVEEFLPDRMTIDARLSAPASPGWISPADLRGRVSLKSLVGTPAVGNRVKATLRLSPSFPAFPRWRDWSFFDPMTAKQSYDETLAESTTNDAGEVELPLGLERFARATYRLRFLAEGFEAEGNRSVANEAGALVSPLPYLVAWQADGDLGFVRSGTPRTVQVVAVGPALDPVPAADVTVELVEVTYVSVLARQESGLLSYTSVKKETPRGKNPLALGTTPGTIRLPTDAPGRFFYVFRDAAGTELNRIPFEVVGEGNVAGRVERNAELKLSLPRTDYAAGEEIEVAIVAPYAGAGLLTIERDRVYAARWFKTSGNSAVERIRVPEELEGNGYVVVSFVRDLGSRDVFTSPLSSGAAPFSVSRARRTHALTLDVTEQVLPGSPLRIGWTAAAPTKLAVFAVDEGILQVARWKTPDPLSHFFRKRALAVTTSQILDLLLPEYEIVRSLAAPGGDQDSLLAGNLNPFKRKGQAPAAFWSGILDVPAGPGSIDYTVPDHFNGTLRVLAVAVNASTVGVTETRTLARGPFVVQPTVPYFAAPGDEFEATAIVTNALEGSGESATVNVSMQLQAGLELVGAGEQPLAIAEGRQAVAKWRVRVTGHPGATDLTFLATSGAHRARASVGMSIRPAAPYQTTVATAVARRGGTAELPVDRALFAELRDVTASASTGPLGLVPGLARYLAEYPHGCTEQVVSKAFPQLILGHGGLGVDPEEAAKRHERARAILQARQNAEGAFGIWNADARTDPFLTAWATHYLLEARARGLAVPEGTLRRALGYLASNLEPPSSLHDLRARAYFVYLLARSGQVKTAETRAIRDTLLAAQPDRWKGDVAAVLLAATFQQLNLEAEAARLLEGVAIDRPVRAAYEHYYDALTERGFVLYLLAKHFPARARALRPEALLGLADEVAKFNTLSAGALVLGLDAYGTVQPPADAAGVALTAVLRDATGKPLPTDGTTVLRADVPDDAARIRFAGPSGTPLFHQLTQSGFDREPPSDEVAKGLEVTREIRGGDGKAVTTCAITSKLDVVLFVRSTDGVGREVALVDLLPGGFEVDLSSDAIAQRRSLQSGAEEWSPAYVDVREDRVVFYGWADAEARRFVYRVKPTNRGRYRVPPVHVEGFYDRAAWGRGLGGEITVGD